LLAIEPSSTVTELPKDGGEGDGRDEAGAVEAGPAPDATSVAAFPSVGIFCPDETGCAFVAWPELAAGTDGGVCALTGFLVAVTDCA
jgi:hypothetical protein